MPARAGDDITVHVEWLARRLTQQQEDAAATEQDRIMVSTHRVSRVPGHVRIPNPDAYTPGLVAIGPLHAKDAKRRLRPGNRLKMAYLHSLISRGHPDPAGHLGIIQGYVRLAAAREREARAMYAAEDVDDVRAEDLIQMLVLDGCFILEHLVNVATGKEEQSLHATPFGPAQLSVDLILAENQIPFFVLADLISSTRLPEFDSTGYAPPVLLMKLALYYLGGEKGRDMSEALPHADAVCHILHLLHAMVSAARTRWEPPPRIQDGATLEMMQEAARLLRRLPVLLLVPLLYPILPEERRWRASYGREDLPSASDLKRMWVQFKKARGGSSSKAPAGIASVLAGAAGLEAGARGPAAAAAAADRVPDGAAAAEPDGVRAVGGAARRGRVGVRMAHGEAGAVGGGRGGAGGGGGGAERRDGEREQGGRGALLPAGGRGERGGGGAGEELPRGDAAEAAGAEPVPALRDVGGRAAQLLHRAMGRRRRVRHIHHLHLHYTADLRILQALSITPETHSKVKAKRIDGVTFSTILSSLLKLISSTQLNFLVETKFYYFAFTVIHLFIFPADRNCLHFFLP
ncbi:hypothetical protein PVAP13_3NG153669 [Panicum virgatum]|uniref:Uncharacterized protein n=1 Tax=Panicum virgatum TaxID=38727 RepID=A0A8T0U1K7_PANVG|nr:hypothetical protein PVAP13_3NG153669 [Panicum virgatum]